MLLQLSHCEVFALYSDLIEKFGKGFCRLSFVNHHIGNRFVAEVDKAKQLGSYKLTVFRDAGVQSHVAHIALAVLLALVALFHNGVVVAIEQFL